MYYFDQILVFSREIEIVIRSVAGDNDDPRNTRVEEPADGMLDNRLVTNFDETLWCVGVQISDPGPADAKIEVQAVARRG